MPFEVLWVTRNLSRCKGVVSQNSGKGIRMHSKPGLKFAHKGMEESIDAEKTPMKRICVHPTEENSIRRVRRTKGNAIRTTRIELTSHFFSIVVKSLCQINGIMQTQSYLNIASKLASPLPSNCHFSLFYAPNCQAMC